MILSELSLMFFLIYGLIVGGLGFWIGHYRRDCVWTSGSRYIHSRYKKQTYKIFKVPQEYYMTEDKINLKAENIELRRAISRLHNNNLEAMIDNYERKLVMFDYLKPELRSLLELTSNKNKDK